MGWCVDARLRRMKGKRLAGRRSASERWRALLRPRWHACPPRRGWSMRPSWSQHKRGRNTRSTPGSEANDRLGRTSDGLRGGRARAGAPPTHALVVCRSGGAEYPPPIAAESRPLAGSWYCGSDRVAGRAGGVRLRLLLGGPHASGVAGLHQLQPTSPIAGIIWVTGGEAMAVLGPSWRGQATERV